MLDNDDAKVLGLATDGGAWSFDLDAAGHLADLVMSARSSTNEIAVSEFPRGVKRSELLASMHTKRQRLSQIQLVLAENAALGDSVLSRLLEQ